MHLAKAACFIYKVQHLRRYNLKPVGIVDLCKQFDKLCWYPLEQRSVTGRLQTTGCPWEISVGLQKNLWINKFFLYFIERLVLCYLRTNFLSYLNSISKQSKCVHNFHSYVIYLISRWNLILEWMVNIWLTTWIFLV